MPEDKTKERKYIKIETGRVEGKRAVRYTDSDGTELYKIGGSKAWRNNNPGNIGCSADVEKYLGSIGCDDAGRSVFPDYKTGDRAMERMLRNWKPYKGKTLEEIIRKYAPPEGGNPTEKYIQFTSQKTGMPRDKDSDDMTGSEFNSLIESIKQFEQTNPGKLVEVSNKEGETTSIVREPVNVQLGKHYDLSKVEYDVKTNKGAPINFSGGRDVMIKRKTAPAEKPSSQPEGGKTSGRKSRVLYPSGPRPEETTVYYSGGGKLPPKSPSKKPRARKGGGCKETLVREGKRVIRKEADCGARGSFVS